MQGLFALLALGLSPETALSSNSLAMQALRRMAALPEAAAAAPSATTASDDPNPMNLVLFDNATVEAYGARCLDGSPSGYYLREGSAPENVAIYLEGGGLCIEPVDCLQRAKGNLGSSTGWAPTHTDAQNILSTDASFNPFANWTHVFVPYGSGDVYIGTQRKPGIDGLYFAGHNTMEAVLDHLLNTTGLATAKNVLLSGGSAGGIGTFQNADWMGGRLREARRAAAAAGGGGVEEEEELNFRAAPQAGGFFVGSDVIMYPEFELDVAINFADFASNYLFGWFGGQGDGPGGSSPYLDASCVKAHAADKPHTCWNAANHYAYIETPLYVVQNMFDSEQAGDIFGLSWWPQPLLHHDEAVARYKAYFGNVTVSDLAAKVLAHGATKTPADGLFMPSCFEHTGNLCMKGGPSVKGTKLAASLADWFFDEGKVAHALVDDCAPASSSSGPCNTFCKCT